MTRFLKKNIAYLIISINIILIFIKCFLVKESFTDIANKMLGGLPEGNIYLFYTYFFKLLGQPMVQGINLSLLFIVYIYAISIIFYGVALFTRVKARFSSIMETFILSYSISVLKKIIEVIYFMASYSVLSNVYFNFITAVIQILVYCKLIQKHTDSSKINNVIYAGLIMLGTVIFNVILIVLSRL